MSELKTATKAAQHWQHKAVAAIPETNLKEWFQNEQQAIEAALPTFSTIGYLQAAAFYAAELNPLAPGQDNYTTKWYQAHTGCSISRSFAIQQASHWLFDSKTVTLGPEYDTLTSGQRAAEKKKQLRRRQQAIKNAKLSTSALIITVKEILRIPEEIQHEQTEMVETALKIVGTHYGSSGRSDIKPTLQKVAEDLRQKYQIDNKPPQKNKAFLQPHQDGGATLHLRMDAPTYAIFKTATRPYLQYLGQNSFEYGNNLAESVITIFRQHLQQNKNLPNLYPAELNVIISEEKYKEYLQNPNLLVSTNQNLTLTASQAQNIAGKTPRKIVIAKGKHTYLANEQKENPDRRQANNTQRIALAIRHPYCAYPNCEVPSQYCEAHHILPWSQGGKTTSDNLVLVCSKHHAQIDDTKRIPGRKHVVLDCHGYPSWKIHGADGKTDKENIYNINLLRHYQRQGWPLPAINNEIMNDIPTTAA